MNLHDLTGLMPREIESPQRHPENLGMADDGEQYDKIKPSKKFLALALLITLNLLI